MESLRQHCACLAVPERILAIYTTMQALVGEGDEVILMEPFYDSYPAAVILAGAKPVYVPLRQRTPYAIVAQMCKNSERALRVLAGVFSP